MKISYGFWGGKKIKLEQLQTVRTDEVGVACQWNGDLMDAQGGVVGRSIRDQSVGEPIHQVSYA